VHFLYPADVLKPRQPDEMYAPEAAAMRAAGFVVAVISLESLGSGQAKIAPAMACGQKLVYRGWMLSPEEYETLASAVAAQGCELSTSPAQYRLAHYLPNWYPLLAEFTPETVVVPADADLEQLLRGLGWGRYFIKDYVKSLKTSVGSIVERPEDVAVVIAEMKKYRGRIEGGLCIRRVEAFLPETEQRHFVIGGQAYAAAEGVSTPAMVAACASRIQSPFFSVDVVRRADGVERIVEIGDGQVSDIVGWEPERFVQMWKTHEQRGRSDETRRMVRT
jgi:hypothetical protein